MPRAGTAGLGRCARAVQLVIGTEVELGATRSTVAAFDDVVDEVIDGAHRRPPTVFVSNNLEHVYLSKGALTGLVEDTEDLKWIVHLDGMPLVWRTRALTRQPIERVNGTDLLTAVLRRCALDGLRVGFFGGTTRTHEALEARLDGLAPGLVTSGFWSPTREEVIDVRRRDVWAEKVAAADTQVLVVSLGKPRQEQWAASCASSTGAGSLLLTGGAIDLLAGLERRAPQWVQRSGLEWAHRALREPVRLGRRYAIQCPAALLQVSLQARLVPADS